MGERAEAASDLVKGYQDGFADRIAGADLSSVHATRLWAYASEDYKRGWGEGYERASRLPYLTLGEFRRRTEHLPDETPITAGGIEGQNPSEWLNLWVDSVPEAFPSGDATSIILGTSDDFDTRQW